MTGKLSAQDRFVNLMPVIALVALLAAGLYVYFC